MLENRVIIGVPNWFDCIHRKMVCLVIFYYKRRVLAHITFPLISMAIRSFSCRVLCCVLLFLFSIAHLEHLPLYFLIHGIVVISFFALIIPFFFFWVFYYFICPLLLLHFFWFLILVLYYCSPCGSRAHAVEHMASPCENQNFWFHSFRFPISTLHFDRHAAIEHIQWNAESIIPSSFQFQCFTIATHAESGISSDFQFKCYTIAPHAAAEHMQWNTWPFLAKIGISDFIVSYFWFWCCTFDHHAAAEHMQWNAESGISCNFQFQCCTVAPHAAA